MLEDDVAPDSPTSASLRPIAASARARSKWPALDTPMTSTVISGYASLKASMRVVVMGSLRDGDMYMTTRPSSLPLPLLL